jgi:adenosylcobinamide-phosphate synthase
MAAMAGALGRRLEKPGNYVLGGGLPAPGPEDIRAAVRLAGAAAGLLAAAALLATGVPTKSRWRGADFVGWSEAWP